jgi:hypothetical protein
MTTRREFECNLCHERIAGGSGKIGRGVEFCQQGIKWVTIQQAENHLCDSCVQALQESFRGEKLAAQK